MPANLMIPTQPKDSSEPAFYIGILNVFISSGWARRQGLKYAGMAAAMAGTYLANHIHPDDTNLIPTVTAGIVAALTLGIEFTQSFFAAHAAPKAIIEP